MHIYIQQISLGKVDIIVLIKTIELVMNRINRKHNP